MQNALTENETIQSYLGEHLISVVSTQNAVNLQIYRKLITGSRQ